MMKAHVIVRRQCAFSCNQLMKTSLKSLVVLATLAVATIGVQANQLTLSTSSSYSVGVGGAFIANVIDGPMTNADYSGAAKIGSTGFLTYCIEYNEEFYPSNLYPSYVYNYALSYGAKNGGLSGQTTLNYDGVSNATAYLYSLFAQGNLAGVGGFSYNASSTGYGYLQQAIWFLEGEGGINNLLAQAAINHEGANWNADNNGAYGVQAINMTYANGGVSQDQLYYHNVPEQGLTVALLGFALLGLAGVRRMIRSK